MLRRLAIGSMFAFSATRASAAQEPRLAVTPTQQPTARVDAIAKIQSGDVALAALVAPARTGLHRTSAADVSGIRVQACANRGQWKCILGGAGLGFLAGALVGTALAPDPIEHRETGYGFFGYYSYMQCDKNCDGSPRMTLGFGIGGSILGGIGGYYLAKASSR